MAFSLRIPVALGCLSVAASCGGPNTADALIGPEGGVVAHDDGVTLTVPPGALLTTRQIVIRPSSEKLTRGTYEQVGGAYLFEPRDLEFKIPAELSFEGDAGDKPVVLLKPGESRVIAYSGADDRAVAYIGTLGIAAMGKGGDPTATVDDPKLARTPADVDLGAAFVDVASLKVTPSNTTVLDLGFTAFNPEGMNAAPLNGEGTNYCGFKLGMILGASITGGCSSGITSATIGLSAPQATAQVVPFLIGKTDEPVIVEVQVGTGDFAVSAGYFPFKTSACYLVSCSGHGMCQNSGNSASCACDDGYAASGLDCNCVPQCEGRVCGGDGCNGSCGNCDEGFDCNNDAGQCVPQMPPPTTDATMDPPDPSTTTAPDPDTTTTTADPDTSTSSTGDPGTTTTGGGSTTTGGSSSTTG